MTPKPDPVFDPSNFAIIGFRWAQETRGEIVAKAPALTYSGKPPFRAVYERSDKDSRPVPGSETDTPPIGKAVPPVRWACSCGAHGIWRALAAEATRDLARHQALHGEAAAEPLRQSA